MTNRDRLMPWCGAAAFAALWLGGCGSSSATTAPGAGAPTSASIGTVNVSTSESVSVGAGGSGGGTAVQACSLLSADQASALLGSPATQSGNAAGSCSYGTSAGTSVTLQVIAGGGGNSGSGLQAALAQVAGPHAAVKQLSGIGDGAAEVTDALGIKGYVQVAFVKGADMYSVGGLGIDTGKLEALVRSMAAQVP